MRNNDIPDARAGGIHTYWENPSKFPIEQIIILNILRTVLLFAFYHIHTMINTSFPPWYIRPLLYSHTPIPRRVMDLLWLLQFFCGLGLFFCAFCVHNNTLSLFFCVGLEWMCDFSDLQRYEMIVDPQRNWGVPENPRGGSSFSGDDSL